MVSGILLVFLQTQRHLLLSWGGELCVHANISSCRILEIFNITLSSKQFLPCCNGKQNNKEVLPNIYKTLTNTP
jgi:hypothetical protein